MQNHYNLLYREEEREMIPFCKEEGIGLIPWSPLAKGFLTGKYKRTNMQNHIAVKMRHIDSTNPASADRCFGEKLDII